MSLFLSLAFARRARMPFPGEGGKQRQSGGLLLFSYFKSSPFVTVLPSRESAVQRAVTSGPLDFLHWQYLTGFRTDEVFAPRGRGFISALFLAHERVLLVGPAARE